MKTATIDVCHVFGTKNTVYACVKYRGKILFKRMENESPNNILTIARDWTINNGFSHIKVNYS